MILLLYILEIRYCSFMINLLINNRCYYIFKIVIYCHFVINLMTNNKCYFIYSYIYIGDSPL